MNDLNSKNILLIMPKFFGYEDAIISNLESRGACVEWIRDRPFDKPLQLLVTRLFPSLMLKLSSSLFGKALENLQFDHVDVVLAINPITMTPVDISSVRDRFPKAKYTLYLWDSVKNRTHMKEIFSFFDNRLTFDPECSKKYNMSYRPLFFRDISRDKLDCDLINYDVSFVGTIHSDRYDVLAQLIKPLEARYSTCFYLYLHAKWLYFAFKLIKKSFRQAKISDFKYEPMPKWELDDVFSTSRVIIDVEHPGQQGLTMRTLEALGAKKKLITTNSNIVYHDFYNENNICIVCRDKPEIPLGFIESEYESLAPDIYYKYSISGWLDELLI